MKGPLPEPAGESVRDDLVMLIAGEAHQAAAQRYGKVTACLLPEFSQDDEMHRMYQAVIEPRRDVMRAGAAARHRDRRAARRPRRRADAADAVGPDDGAEHAAAGTRTCPRRASPRRLVDAVLRGAHA